MEINSSYEFNAIIQDYDIDHYSIIYYNNAFVTN